MEILKYCNDRIVDSPYISLKRNGGMAGSLIQGGSSILGSVLGFLTNENTNDLNDIINQRQIQASKDMLKSEQDYNTYMMHNQKQMQMQDAKQAGVNPAFAQGSQIGNQSPSPSGSLPSALPMHSYDWNNISGIGQAINEFLLQKKAVDADVRQKNADAERQELLNEDKKAKNKVLNQEYNEYWRTPDGQVLTNDQADVWVKSHPNSLPEFIREKDTRADKGSEGRFEGQKSLREWNSRVNQLNELDWRNALSEAVSKSQLSDKDVLDALKNMPRKEFDKLTQIVTSLSNENSIFDKRRDLVQVELDMAKLQKQIQEDSNLYQYINKMFTGDFGWKDFAKLIAMTVVGLVQNMSGIGVGFKNLRDSFR